MNWLMELLGFNNPSASQTTPQTVAGAAGMPVTGQAGQVGQTGIAPTLGFNIPTLNLGLNGLQALNNFSMGRRSMNLAENQFNTQKQFAQTNLDNQLKTFNSALEGRAQARGLMQGWSDDQTNAYIDKNRL